MVGRGIFLCVGGNTKTQRHVVADLFVCDFGKRNRPVGVCGDLETQNYQLFIRDHNHLDVVALLLFDGMGIRPRRGGALVSVFIGRAVAGVRGFMGVFPFNSSKTEGHGRGERGKNGIGRKIGRVIEGIEFVCDVFIAIKMKRRNPTKG